MFGQYSCFPNSKCRNWASKPLTVYPTLSAHLFTSFAFMISDQTQRNFQIRRPMLARGMKAAGLSIIRFLTIIGHVFSYQAICCYVFSGPKSRVDPPRQITGSEFVAPPKIHCFSNLFSRRRKLEKMVPRAKEQESSTTKFVKTRSV